MTEEKYKFIDNTVLSRILIERNYLSMPEYHDTNTYSKQYLNPNCNPNPETKPNNRQKTKQNKKTNKNGMESSCKLSTSDLQNKNRNLSITPFCLGSWFQGNIYLCQSIVIQARTENNNSKFLAPLPFAGLYTNNMYQMKMEMLPVLFVHLWQIGIR